MNKRIKTLALLILIVCALLSTTITARALPEGQLQGKDKFEEIFGGEEEGAIPPNSNPKEDEKEDIWAEETLGCVLCGEEHTGLKKGTMAMTAYDWCCAVYGGQIFAKGSDNIDVMKFDTSSSTFAEFWNTAQRFYSAMANIGLVLCALYGLLHMMDMATADSTTPERICMVFIKMTLGAIIVQNGFDIVTACMKLGSGAFSAVFGELGVPEGSMKSFCNYNDLVKKTEWGAIGEMLALFVPYIGMLAMQGAALVVAWVRVLELTARIIFAPIGISDLIYEGSRSSGFMYVKKLAACAMQGAVLLLIARVYSALSNAVRVLPGISFGWITILILGFTTIVVMFKAQTLTNDLLAI